MDYGQRAPTLWKPGQYQRPCLFVMTLKYSGKSFRKVVWKTDQEIWARLLFAQLGRPGQRALYGLTNLARTHTCADIEAVCTRFLEVECISYAAIRRALERQAATPSASASVLVQKGPVIRAIAEYQSFWEAHAQSHLEEDADGHVHP